MKSNYRQIITMSLGFLTMAFSALYVVFWNYSIYTSYTGKAVYGLLYIIGIKNVVIASLMAHAFQITLVALTVLGIKYFFDACRSAEYQRMISGGYAFLGATSFIYLIGMYVSTFIFNRDYFVRKANTSYYMMVAFILLIIYALYKCLLAKEKAHSFMNIFLVAATVCSFLAGGILRADAHYNIVGNDHPMMGKVVAILIGITQSMPFLFLCYFEFFYLPDRIKRPERYEGFIKDAGEEEDDVELDAAEEMDQITRIVDNDGEEHEVEEVKDLPEEETDEDDLEDIADVIEGKFKL